MPIFLPISIFFSTCLKAPAACLQGYGLLYRFQVRCRLVDFVGAVALFFIYYQQYVLIAVKHWTTDVNHAGK